MEKSAKVAISLPERILQAVEKERTTSGESRSEFFRRAVEELLKKKEEQQAIDQYVKGYREIPESSEDVDTIHKLASETLAGEPW